MKFFTTTLSIAVASAEWSVWMDDMTCGTEQPLLDQSFANDLYTFADVKSSCQQWCGTASHNYVSQIVTGDPLCCGAELWSDGESNCYLYMGQQMDEILMSEGDFVSAMDFRYGSQEDTGAIALKTAFGVMAAIALVMQ